MGCFHSVTADTSTVFITLVEFSVSETVSWIIPGIMNVLQRSSSDKELGRYRFSTFSKLLTLSDVLEVLGSRCSIFVFLYQEKEEKKIGSKQIPCFRASVQK